MKKKLLSLTVLSLLVCNALVFSQTEAQIKREQIDRENKEYLEKQGIYIPLYSEINIVSANKYLNKENIKSNDDAFFAKKVQEYISMNEQQKNNGYVKLEEPRVKELMDLNHTYTYQLKKYQNEISPVSTHLRESIDNLKMAYTFIGIPPSEISKNYGFSPYGAYKETRNGDAGDGWDGAIQFFKKNNIGSCAYTEHNRMLAKSGVELIKELVSYEINNKPSIVLVQGTEGSGFLYKIKWYDSIFSRTLECVNNKFDINIKDDVIQFGRIIDEYQVKKT